MARHCASLGEKTCFVVGVGLVLSNEMQARLISLVASSKFASPSDIVELSDEVLL